MAIVDSSPEPNAIAVGPSRIGDSASSAVSFAAIRISRFLTTRYDTSCLRSERRISAISLTLRPRYSETISVVLQESSSFSAATVSRLASVGMGTSRGTARSRRAAVAPIRPRGRFAPATVHLRLQGGATRVREARPASACSPSSPGAIPVRCGGSSPDRPAPGSRRGPRAQAVLGVRRIRLSATRRGQPATVAAYGAAGRSPGGGRRRSGHRGGEDARDVDPDARAHGAGDRQALEVLALRAGRLGPVDRVDQGGEVGDQLRRPRSCPCRRRRG